MQHRAVNAGEVIGIEETGWRASVTKLPDDEVRADDQIAHDLALHSETYMDCVGAGQVRASTTNPCLSASMLVTEKSRLFGSPRAWAKSCGWRAKLVVLCARE